LVALITRVIVVPEIIDMIGHSPCIYRTGAQNQMIKESYFRIREDREIEFGRAVFLTEDDAKWVLRRFPGKTLLC
jgi:hypothetical protein